MPTLAKDLWSLVQGSPLIDAGDLALRSRSRSRAGTWITEPGG